MAMTGTDLAEAIRSEMGFPLPVSQQLEGWGAGVVQHIQNSGLVNHASGTVTGSTSPGAPLSNGAATGGIISGLTGPDMATLVVNNAGYPNVSSELAIFCQEITDHIMTLGTVTFDPGTITGSCTSTALSPGPLTNGAGTGGYIIGLAGSTLADSIHSSVGYPGSTSSKLNQFCTAIVQYIMDNAEVQYAAGTVTGTCPAGGGPLQAGTGTGGTIS